MLKNIISRVNVICGNRAALKCLFAVLLITTGVGTASAYDFKTGGLCYNILSNQDKTVEVTYYYYSSDYYDRFNSYDSDKLDAYGLSGYKGDPVIPEKVNYNGKNYTVVAIGDHAFESCYDLTSVKIPASVTEIGDAAFKNCSHRLVSVDMPSVTMIGSEAFYDCQQLSSANMPSVTAIGDRAFYSCLSLHSLDIPSVTTIGSDAFFDACISYVDIPASVTSIGESAFSACGNLIYVSCRWQEPLECNSQLFMDGTLRQTLYVPIGTKSAYEQVYPWSEFRNVVERNDFEVGGLCYNVISEEEKTVEVTYYIFYEDYNYFSSSQLDDMRLTGYKGDLVIPEKVNYKGKNYTVVAIGNHAFESCYYLTSVTIPATVTEIGDSAFKNCLSLVSVDMPSVMSIGESAFQGSALASVEMPLATEIGNSAFSDCSLTSVEMPLVTSIGGSAFGNCTSLASVEMPLVTEIGSGAFDVCTSLASVGMPSVTSIGDGAFYGCTSLASVEMPSVTSIGDKAFQDCTSLAFIDIPASVTSIGYGAFDCENLTSVYCHWQVPLELVSYIDPFYNYSATLYVPVGTKSAYETVYPWSGFKNIVEKNYSSIDEPQSSAPSVTVIDGAIVIGDETGAAQAVEVYSIGGQCVHRGMDARIEGLPQGVYVIKVGESTQKVVL